MTLGANGDPIAQASLGPDEGAGDAGVQRSTGPGPTGPRPTAGDRWRQSLVLVTILATIAFNALANILPLLGRTTGALSDAYPVPFTPAGYVFSIWGLIYTGLVVFGVWQARPAQAGDPRLRAVAPWVVLAGAMNIGWLVLWHADRPVLSTLPIVGLLLCLIVVYETLASGRHDGGWMRWAARIPFGIYLGWLTVATAANLSVSGWALGWRGAPFGADVWALIVVAVAAVIGLRVLSARGDIAFALVLVWAFIGIAVANGIPGLLAFGALIFAALVLGGAIGRAVQQGGALPR